MSPSLCLLDILVKHVAELALHGNNMGAILASKDKLYRRLSVALKGLPYNQSVTLGYFRFISDDS